MIQVVSKKIHRKGSCGIVVVFQELVAVVVSGKVDTRK